MVHYRSGLLLAVRGSQNREVAYHERITGRPPALLNLDTDSTKPDPNLPLLTRRVRTGVKLECGHGHKQSKQHFERYAQAAQPQSHNTDKP